MIIISEHNDYCTMTAENATVHVANKIVKNVAPSTIFQHSSMLCRNLPNKYN
jgi:hypothetical protein